MKKTLYTLTLLATIAGACQKQQTTTQPTVQAITEAVYATGYIVPKNEYQVFSKAEGYLVRKLVNDGDAVTTGEPLFVIENEGYNSRYQNAIEVYQMARNNYQNTSPVLEELAASLQNARQKLAFDSTNYQRYNNLLASNATTRLEYDRSRLSLENSRNEYLLQKSRYDKLKNQLYLDMRNAETQLKIATEDHNSNIIRSRMDGRLFQTLKQEGELVKRNEPIALVGDKEVVYLQLRVDELDLGKVKEGQDILVKLDAYKDQVFKARLTKIYPLVDRREQSFRVDAEFTDEVPARFSGLGAEANIIISHKEKALTIPRTALVANDSVRITENGEEKTIHISTGLQTMEKVEVTKGLTETSTLLIR